MTKDQCVFIRGFRVKCVLFRIRPIRIEADSFGDCDDRRDDKMQVIRVSCAQEVGCLLVWGDCEESWYVNFSMTTRLNFPLKMKIHNVPHIDTLHFIETTAYVMHHAQHFSVVTRSSGVQIQVRTRLCFRVLSTMKIQIYLILRYRVTKADATPQSWPPPVITHSSRFRTISRRCVLLGTIVCSNCT